MHCRDNGISNGPTKEHGSYVARNKLATFYSAAKRVLRNRKPELISQLAALLSEHHGARYG